MVHLRLFAIGGVVWLFSTAPAQLVNVQSFYELQALWGSNYQILSGMGEPDIMLSAFGTEPNTYTRVKSTYTLSNSQVFGTNEISSRAGQTPASRWGAVRRQFNFTLPQETSVSFDFSADQVINVTVVHLRNAANQAIFDFSGTRYGQFNGVVPAGDYRLLVYTESTQQHAPLVLSSLRYDARFQAVPEPATWLVLGAGLPLVLRRRRKTLGAQDVT